jgi:hypothetical protein
MRRCSGMICVARELLAITLSQHRDTTQPDEWFYEMPDSCDGGLSECAADALHTAVRSMHPQAVE